jgi:S-layer homology domain
MDCDGNFLAVNQIKSSVVVAPSGEPTSCVKDLPWMSETPSPVTVPPHSSVAISVDVNAATLPPGLRLGQLQPITDTPYATAPVPFGVTVAFNDVHVFDPQDPYIHALAGAGIAYGCGGGNFCPQDPILRAYYAVWGLRSLLGAVYAPVPAVGLLFDDVAPESYGADFIEDIYERGLMDACGPGLFCPAAGIPRGQGAEIVLRTLEGPAYEPPAATGMFADLPPSDPDAAWAEELVRRGIDPGCGGGGYFCPGYTMSRGDMSVWLVKAYGMPVLLP